MGIPYDNGFFLVSTPASAASRHSSFRHRRKDGGAANNGCQYWQRLPTPQVDRHDVYVKPLDGRDARWRVSRNGANQPKWSRDGRTIFFLANDSLFAAEWRPEQSPPVGTVRTLFRLGVLRGAWDVMPGDSTFVMIAPNQAERTHVVVIANFVEQLRRSTRSDSARR